MARLSVVINGELQTFQLTEVGLKIGRSPDNDIVLNNVIVSRSHALVRLDGNEAFVEDNNSRNGISVNRLRVTRERLNDGDSVQVGPFEIRFEDRAVQSVVIDDNKYFPLAAEAREVLADSPDIGLDLREFYRITKRLNAIVGFRDLLDAVMEEVLRAVPAQRAMLLLQRNNELVPMIVHPNDQQELVMSSSMVRKVMEDHEAVLTRDARLDFGGTQSIISANIRSAICVPLIADGRTIGLINVDSPGRDQFGERERDMLIAVANQAAIHIERAQLFERLQQQEQQRQLFERFVSPNIAQDVARYFLEHGRLREPQELTVTVLFADVKDFSSLSERLKPREVQDILNEYLHEMTEVIFRHGGTLDKYIGDGIMALFGAPPLDTALTAEAHAVRAVDAALGMIAAHRRLIEKRDASRAFDFRIGINTGPVYAGFFGTRQRLEYTVLGDAVNTASRIEGKAEPNTVLISDATLAMLGDRFGVEERGEMELKGKAQRVRTFKVLGRIKGGTGELH